MIDTESLSDTVTKAIHTFCELPTGECEDCYSFSLDVRVHNITSPPEQVFLAAWRHSSAGVMPVELDPQTPIGRYFADFSVSALDYFVNAWFKLPLQTLEEISKIAPRYAIEIDGFEWHDKTPEQAERDKKREREIQLAGYTVIRFAAREVIRDPMACVCEVRLERICRDIQTVCNRLMVG